MDRRFPGEGGSPCRPDQRQGHGLDRERWPRGPSPALGAGQVRGPPEILDTALAEPGDGPPHLPSLSPGWNRGRPSSMDTREGGWCGLQGRAHAWSCAWPSGHTQDPGFVQSPTAAYAPQGPGVRGLPDICHACAWALGVHTRLGEPVYVKPHDILDCAWLPGTHTLTHTAPCPQPGHVDLLSVSVCQSRCCQDSP